MTESSFFSSLDLEQFSSATRPHIPPAQTRILMARASVHVHRNAFWLDPYVSVLRRTSGTSSEHTTRLSISGRRNDRLKKPRSAPR